MWELDCEESWALKNWCFWTVVLEKTLESPLDCKEIQPVHSEGDQPWDFFGRNDAKAETPVLWPPHGKSWLIGKESDAGRDWEQEEKGTIENEMVGWHHWFNGPEFEWTPGVGDGQVDPACCDSRGRKESDMTEWLNWLNWTEGHYKMDAMRWDSLAKFLTFEKSSLPHPVWQCSPASEPQTGTRPYSTKWSTRDKSSALESSPTIPHHTIHGKNRLPQN